MSQETRNFFIADFLFVFQVLQFTFFMLWARKFHFLWYKKHFKSSESWFLKSKKPFRVSVSWTVRRFYFLIYKDFFRGFRFLKYKKSFLLKKCKIFSFFELGLKSAGFHFGKYKKSLLLRKHKNFFNIRTRKFHFVKYKKFFLGLIFFYFLSLGLKVRQVAAYYSTNITT